MVRKFSERFQKIPEKCWFQKCKLSLVSIVSSLLLPALNSLLDENVLIPGRVAMTSAARAFNWCKKVADWLH